MQQSGLRHWKLSCGIAGMYSVFLYVTTCAQHTRCVVDEGGRTKRGRGREGGREGGRERGREGGEGRGIYIIVHELFPPNPPRIMALQCLSSRASFLVHQSCTLSSTLPLEDCIFR